MSGFTSIRWNRRRPSFSAAFIESAKADESWDFLWIVALFFVDRVEKIERIGQHMPRAAGGITDLDLFGLADLQEVGLRLFGRDVVVHLLSEP